MKQNKIGAGKRKGRAAQFFKYCETFFESNRDYLDMECISETLDANGFDFYKVSEGNPF